MMIGGMPDADSLHVQFANNPQPIVTFVTTEHYNLQAERAVTTSETNGRAAIFLATLSSGLVALAFIGQASHLGPPFYAFALVLFIVLLFLGTVTFARAIQSSIADVVAGAGSSAAAGSTSTLRPAWRPTSGIRAATSPRRWH